MPDINTPLLPRDDLRKKIADTMNQTPKDPGSKTTDKTRWFQGIVRNCTQFPLTVRPPPYFDSGRYEEFPIDTAPFSVTTFTGVNKDNSILAGVTGANGWNLHLQAGLEIYLSAGWTAPYAGGYKLSFPESINTKDAYDQASEGGNKARVKNEYNGADEDGNDMTITFQIESSGGQKKSYIITQIVL